MKKSLLGVATALVLNFGILPAGAQAPATSPTKKHFVILADFSGSNPMIDDKAHAARIAADVDRRLKALGLGMQDRITIQTFGVYDPTKQITIDRTVNLHLPEQAARGQVANLIAGMPEAVRTKGGRLAPQSRTNIAAALLAASQRVNCRETEVHVFVLTDGEENSVHGHMPPKPAERVFSGCASMEMLGVLASNRDPLRTRALGSAWMTYCSASGFKSCTWSE